MMGRRGGVRPLRVRRFRDGAFTRDRDALAVEEPLEIRVARAEAGGTRRSEPFLVTMRTPGDDFDLVAGLLFAEGVVERAEDLLELTYCRGGEEAQAYNVVEARLAPGVAFDADGLRRNVLASSACGVCGKTTLDALEAAGCVPMPVEEAAVDAALVATFPDRMQREQGNFARTGGLHAAGLFDDAGRCRVLREDVGRHNAVDKVVGHALLRREVPLEGGILVVSGRTSYEIVQKAVRAGIPLLVAVGAPSSMAVETARRFGQTLVGFARDGGFNVYAHPERIS